MIQTQSQNEEIRQIGIKSNFNKYCEKFSYEFLHEVSHKAWYKVFDEVWSKVCDKVWRKIFR